MGVLCESGTLFNSEGGLIVELVFTGRLEVGAQGNSDANKMSTYVTRVVKNYGPAAVLFNLSNLEYEFGDAIGAIAVPLITTTKSAIAACFVAKGTTAQALQ
jgi:hypothetical protein